MLVLNDTYKQSFLHLNSVNFLHVAFTHHGQFWLFMNQYVEWSYVLGCN